MKSVLSTTKKDHLTSSMFLDEGGAGIARYESSRYPVFTKLADDMISLFWVPDEIDLSKDKRDFAKLSEPEKHIFTSNLKRQIVLDTIQGRAPNLCFLPVLSVPEVESVIDILCEQEVVHSKSYTHILRNVYNDPSEVFDGIMEIKEIIDLVKSISVYYDNLLKYNAKYTLETEDYDKYEHKKHIYLALVSWHALEAVRFYVSFACSWSYAEKGSMIGNADIIRLICRDEERHKHASAQIINIIKRDDPDFAQIAEELEGEATQLYIDVAEQEKVWADYLFKDGSMIGLNKQILCDFVEWRTNLQMKAIGLESPYNRIKNNPIPWINQWINASSVQVAPQETEITSYLNGIVRNDIENTPIDNLFDLSRALKLAKG